MVAATATAREGRTIAAAPVLDFDTRLALAGAAIDHRLTRAGLAVAVNTAHIDIEPAPVIDAPPVTLRPTMPCPYSTPVATHLWKARQLLEERGWCKGAASNEQGAICPWGAIQYADRGSSHIHDALDVLLDAIRRDFQDAQSIPHWNDRHGNPYLAYRFLDQAAELAHGRNR
ncbi:hypothetical protein ACFWPQ_01825 [Streptomyces sp. NPDC058464]|uniref:DUF6197 family protein n=1 Tax=Streptomyces sp. NPDC058464 TaxID=3346511 RepID=UPI0036656BE2